MRLIAIAIWAAVEVRRKCVLSLHVDHVGNRRIADFSEACGGPNRLSVYTNSSSVTVYPVPTPQTTNLPGNWQYSRCLACVAVLSCYQTGARCSLRFIASLMAAGSSRIRLYPLKTTQPKTVFHSAQNLVILLRVWNMAMSAVSDPPCCGALSMSLTCTILLRVR